MCIDQCKISCDEQTNEERRMKDGSCLENTGCLDWLRCKSYVIILEKCSFKNLKVPY